MADEPQDPPSTDGAVPPAVDDPQVVAGHPNIKLFVPKVPAKASGKTTQPDIPLSERVKTMSKQERQELVYELRALQKWTWHQIAKMCGTSIASMQRDYERRRRQLSDDSQETRRYEAKIGLEAVIAGMMPKVQRGDAEAGMTVVRAIESIRKLYGDDAPTKIASTTPDGQSWAPLWAAKLQLLSDEQLVMLQQINNLKLLPGQVLEGEAS